MNPSIKQVWTDALRSNNYKQGQGNLRHGDCYCCLGVLTDIYIQQHGGEWHHDVADLYSFQAEGGVLPRAVQEWADLDSPNPRVSGLDIAARNDDGQDFELIASLIDCSL
jgi:hypothetical protein